jgi:peptide/nickel transport system substrate-binding protein
MDVAPMIRTTHVLAVAIAVAVASCGGGDKAGNAGNGGGILTVGMRTDFQPINPITAGDQYTVELINYALFTPLVQYDSQLNVRPYLAEKWDMTDTAVTFTLRRDVKWHDGQPVTAEDVKFTFDMAKDPATASLIGSAYLPNVKSAEVVDSYTVHFTFDKPHSQALEDFWWAPAPKHLLQNVTAADMRNAPYNRQPVGSGPFKFSQWQANQRIVLERNADFPASLGGPAKLERVVIRVIPEPSTRLTELITGGVQVDIPVSAEQTKQLQQNSAASLISYPAKTLYYVGWNNKRPPFNNSGVRRALAMAINRQEIIDALLSGQATAATSTVPPWHRLYPKDAAAITYDVAGAERLLDSLGWKKGADGARSKGGTPLKFTILTSDNPLNRSVSEVIQSQLRKVGANAEIRSLEFQTFLTQFKSRDFDAVFANWVLDNFQMSAVPAALFYSKLASVPKSTNRASVMIPELDKLIDQASAATTDDQARAVYRDMTNLLQREQPITFLYWQNELAGVRKEVQGVSMDQRGDFTSIASWGMRR